MKRRIISILGIVFLLMGFAPGAALAANPSRVGCVGAGCRGKDPQVMGCDSDAMTVAISPQPGTAGAGWQEVVELRYSRRCNARWSRVTSRLAAGQIVYTTAYIAGYPSTRRTVNGAKVVWSRMWSSAIKACGNSIWSGDPSYKPVHCTP